MTTPPDDLQIPDRLFFRIGEIAELLGVEPHVLRYWESEFRIRPQRSPTGQRMYRRKDISRFAQIRTLLYQDGYTIAGARRALSGDRGRGESADVDTALLEDAARRLEAVHQGLLVLRERIDAHWKAPADG